MAKTTDTRRRDSIPLEVPYPSKVSLPSRRPAIVRRQRLIDLLAAGSERRVTLMSAPAGYGKTTLLLDFAQSAPVPVCWYSLDERDRDLDTFLRYFVACGQAQFPGFAGELATALREDALPGPDGLVDMLVAATEAAGQPFLIILDDFHCLDDSPENLRRALEGWLYRLPQGCHVVLSGRTWPQLSVLPLMSARQEVAAISSPEFAFSCEEVVQLFRDVLRKEVSLDDAAHLAGLTEGWAAALVLMADKVHLARTSIGLEQLRGSDTLFQYIKLEQFDPLPEDVKQFLTASALTRKIDVDFINQLLGSADTEDRLNYLSQRNLFIVSDPGGGGDNRYHKLFRAFLVSHLRAQEPERFRELNLRAAQLNEEAQEWQEAVYHYLQAGAWAQIVRVTERVGRQLFEGGKWDTLAEWLEAIPPEELAAQPGLLLWKARMLHYLNQPDRALSLLAPAIAGFEAGEHWQFLAEALVVRGMSLRVKGDYAESKEALSRARALLAKHDGPASALTEARKELGITLGMSGEFEKSQQELTAVLEVYEAQGDAYNIAHVSDQLGTCLLFLGKLPSAQPYLERARPRWLKLGNDQRLLQTLNNLGLSFYLQGDYDSADRVWGEAMDKARAAGDVYSQVYLLACLADIRKDKGAYQEAIDLYRAALETGGDLDEAYIRIYVIDALANSYRLNGDVNSAEPLVRRALAEAGERGGVFELGMCTLSQGLVERDGGRLKEAAASIERAVALMKEASAKRELATAYFHLAGTYFSLKRKRLALECLEMAAAAVAELGYDHFLQVEAARNPLLVQYAAANKLADGYYARLLKVAKKAAAPAALVPTEEAEADEQDSSAIYAYGLGHLRVEIGGREVTDLEWRSEKSKEMFFFFLCNRRPLRKDEILAALWPDLSGDKTSSAFHSTLYRLRQALYPECIAKESGRYILDPQGRFVFDLDKFQKALSRAEASPAGSPEAIAFMEKALAQHKGPFAQDFYGEWVETLRWQTEEQSMRLLSTLAAAYSDAGEFKRSADLCQRILEVDEYNEAAWYRLMSNYLRSGQIEAAKYCYNRHVQILSDGGDAEDVAEFDEIQRRIAAGSR